MKSLAAVAFVVLFAAAASAKTPKKAEGTVAAATKMGDISCTTPGDAMGSIVLKVGTTITATEFGMDDSVTKYGAAQIIPGGAELSAVKAGKPANFWFRTPKSNEFGGAVSDAVLFALGGKQADGHRNAYMARGGTVYILRCQN